MRSGMVGIGTILVIIAVLLVVAVLVAAVVLAIVLPIALSKKKTVQATEAKPVDKTCENCGAVVSADQKFCVECGTSVKSEEKEDSKQ